MRGASPWPQSILLTILFPRYFSLFGGATAAGAKPRERQSISDDFERAGNTIHGHSGVPLEDTDTIYFFLAGPKVQEGGRQHGPRRHIQSTLPGLEPDRILPAVIAHWSLCHDLRLLSSHYIHIFRVPAFRTHI
jgi:hypothetical protein